MDTYVTKQNETLDLACFKHYRRTKDVLEQVIEANPQVIDAGSLLPFGTVLHMPVVEKSDVLPPLVSLWD